MNCPPELQLLLSVVQTGVLRIRAAGWANDPLGSPSRPITFITSRMLQEYSDERCGTAGTLSASPFQPSRWGQ